MASLNDIRSTFLSYFEKQGHEVVASSPLVPRNDPTLMFTNSGMVQFKNLFTGLETRDYSRATTAQKCVRAGGKHNDLDNVGYTARHHTFFEMLGNFSFGDYFKAEAIPFAFELITREFGIPAGKLYATVYHTDDDAAQIWKKVGIPDDRIIRIATSDNFWQMGPTGPCGPCTEIFYDHGPEIWGGPPGSAEEDGDRFIEIWNIVFMQNEQFEDGSMRELDMQSIDTGMGLERIGALLQGKHDNYDTDLMRSLIEASANATSTEPDGAGNVHHRVIADHLRSTSFLIADGVMPSNEGRGYVLRRIMRRAMRHAHLLGAQDPVMYRLVPALVQKMGAAYPELTRAQTLITETLELEETRFKQTLGTGSAAAGGRTGRVAAGRRSAGRGRVQALRYLRLPAGPDAGRAARERAFGGRRGLRCGDGRTEGQGPRRLVRLGRIGGCNGLVRRGRQADVPPISWATTPKVRKVSFWRSSRMGRKFQCWQPKSTVHGWSSTRRRSTPRLAGRWPTMATSGPSKEPTRTTRRVSSAMSAMFRNGPADCPRIT